MTAKSPPAGVSDPQAPFGTQPRRSKGPLVLLGVLYLVWFLVLFWMAAFRPGD